MSAALALLRVLWPVPLLALLWWGASHAVDQVRAEARVAGQRDVQQRWDQDTASRAVAAQRASEDAMDRSREQRRNLERIADDQARLSAVQASALVAARAERERLRNVLAAAASAGGGGAGPADQPAAGGLDAAAAVTRSLLDRCVERREDVARDAGALAGQLTGLQAWARSALQACGDQEDDRPP